MTPDENAPETTPSGGAPTGDTPAESVPAEQKLDDPAATGKLPSDPAASVEKTAEAAAPAPLGGPLYGLHKASSAVGLARRVAARGGVPCEAVYWNHAEDSDFEEIRDFVDPWLRAKLDREFGPRC